MIKQIDNYIVHNSVYFSVSVRKSISNSVWVPVRTSVYNSVRPSILASIQKEVDKC